MPPSKRTGTRMGPVMHILTFPQKGVGYRLNGLNAGHFAATPPAGGADAALAADTPPPPPVAPGAAFAFALASFFASAPLRAMAGRVGPGRVAASAPCHLTVTVLRNSPASLDQY